MDRDHFLSPTLSKNFIEYLDVCRRQGNGFIEMQPNLDRASLCVTAICSGGMANRLMYNKGLFGKELWGLFEGGAI
jgi:hypothetical protein